MVEIEVNNLVPKSKYNITINRVMLEIPVLENPSTQNVQNWNEDPCSKLGKLVEDLWNTKTEKEVKEIREKLKEQIKVAPLGCSYLNDAKEVLNYTTQTRTIGPLKRGEKIVVTVIRLDNDQKWEYTYSTGTRGVWTTTYGFAFIPNSFSKEQRFYLGSGNTITEENNQKKIDYAPGIFFNWIPAKYENTNFSVGFAGGLGVNFNVDPVVFLGGSVIYNKNISLNFGLVAHQQYFLKGRYKVGDTIAEDNFDEETGLHQKLFRVNPFVSVSFRFGTNPFSREQE